ncbi:MAG: sigma-70 family RNA polymerase sigma factor [Alphaproteobacteria bacterium]|nr:sigma-70 family RNA polymerase sigma factor [Alphaproteobacteria bacterium]
MVGLACNGDRDAFAELVRRRQSWIRNLMRRCSGDPVLADDLAQTVFLQAWRNISQLRKPSRFGGWLKRLAVTVWLQHLRKHDPLLNADEIDGAGGVAHAIAGREPGIATDLDRALAALAGPVRLCIVLSYHEGMTQSEIADLTELPLGTVKSHINRGTRQLQTLLSDYNEKARSEEPHDE